MGDLLVLSGFIHAAVESHIDVLVDAARSLAAQGDDFGAENKKLIAVVYQSGDSVQAAMQVILAAIRKRMRQLHVTAPAEPHDPARMHLQETLRRAFPGLAIDGDERPPHCMP